MLFKFNEINGWVEKIIIAPGLLLRPGTRTPPGGRVRRPDYVKTQDGESHVCIVWLLSAYCLVRISPLNCQD
jgi:hypothetical protein